MSVKVTKTHLKELVKEAIEEVLFEARSLSSLYKVQFATVASKLRSLSREVIELEKMYNEKELDHSFLRLSVQVFNNLFGDPRNKLELEDLEAIKLNEALPLYYYILKFRAEMIENSEDSPDYDGANQMTSRNKVFYSDEYDLLSNMAFSLSEAVGHLENFNDNTSKYFYEQLDPFFQRYKEAHNGFLKFYAVHKPRFEIKLSDDAEPPRHTGRHAGSIALGNTNLRQSHEKMKQYPAGY